MAVVTTKAHGTKLSDVNGFYRVEDYNLPPGTGITVATRLLANVQFANAGVLKGCMGLCVPTTAYFNTLKNGIMVCLFSNINTFTADATTDVITTVTDHGYSDGDMVVVRIETGAVIPGGLTSEHCYYVINSTTNTFKVSLTSGGAAVNITSTGSGTLRCANAVAWKKKTLDDIYGTHVTDFRAWRDMLTPFEFDTYKTGTSLSVTADADKYWLGFYTLTNYYGGIDQQADWNFSLTTILAAKTYDAPMFAIWCTNEVNFTDNDTLLVFKHTIIDKSFSIAPQALPNGVTGYSTAMIIGYDPTQTYPYMLDTEETVAASYTMTIKGTCFAHCMAGWRIGRENHPVTAANMFRIVRADLTFGTDKTYIFLSSHFVDDGNSNVSLNIAFYGAVPTKSYTTLTNNEIATATELEVDDDMTASWVAGEKVVVTKNNGKNLIDADIYTIDSVTSTKITLTTGITDPKLAGGYVIRVNCYDVCANGYGIVFKQEVTSPASPCAFIGFGISPNMTMRGVYGYNFVPNYGDGEACFCRPNKNLCSEGLIEDCFFQTTFNSTLGVYSGNFIGEQGIKLNRVLCYRFATTAGSYTYANKTYKYTPGKITIWNCKVFSTYRTTEWSYQSAVAGVILPTFDIRNYERHDYNSYASAWFNGVACYYDNVKFFVPSVLYTEYPQIWLSNLIDPVYINNIGVEGQYRALWVSANVSTNVNITNSAFGQVFPNTYDAYIAAGAYFDVHLSNCTGLVGLDTADLEGSVDGSKFRFTSYNGVVGDDRTYQPYGETQRCGTGLTDTTTLVSTDTYSVRMKPTTSTNLHHWEQDVPTGNIQSRDMSVSVWVKINNAAYYAGTNRLPRLTVTYDGVTQVYCQAAQTSDAQKLFVNFTPTTTTGKITIKIDGYTDATGSDAYFYFGHFGILYPTGYALDLADLDNWDRGLPVTPTISTVNADAGSLLDALIANHQVTGSIGKKISDLKNASYIVDGEIIV